MLPKREGDLPLHEESNLAVHLVEGEVAVLVDVGITADHLDATDAANSLRRCPHGVAHGVTEGVRRTTHDLGDPDNSARDMVLVLGHSSSKNHRRDVAPTLILHRFTASGAPNQRRIA